MTKPRNHRLRANLWRLNAAMALGLAWLVWSVASAPDPSSAVEDRDWDAEAATDLKPWTKPDRSHELRAFLRAVHNIHPVGPAARRAAPESVPTRLPLRAFEIAMVWHDDEPGYFLMLDSKDPAHDEKYFFEPGKPDRDAELLGVRTDATRLYASVRRGEEQFEFSTPLRATGLVRSDIICVFAKGERPPTVRDTGNNVTYLGSRPALKGVPFFENGRVVGLRITGIRPDSWAVEMGLQRGDVVRSVDKATVSDAGKAKTRLGTGTVPQTIEVTRLSGHDEQRLSLTRG